MITACAGGDSAYIKSSEYILKRGKAYLHTRRRICFKKIIYKYI